MPVIPNAPLKNQIVNNDEKMQKRFLTAFEMTPHFAGGNRAGVAAAKPPLLPLPFFPAKRPSFRSEARNLAATPVIGNAVRNLSCVNL